MTINTEMAKNKERNKVIHHDQEINTPFSSIRVFIIVITMFCYSMLYGFRYNTDIQSFEVGL